MNSNPILEKPVNFFVYLLFWLIVAVVHIALISQRDNIALAASITDGIVYNVLCLTFGLGIWYPVKYTTSSSYSFYRILLKHTLAGILFSVLLMLTGYLTIYTFFDFGTDYYSFVMNVWPWRFLAGIWFYLWLAAFYYLVIYYSEFRDRDSRESELKNLITEAELKSLKFQINPHFIFNSLNSMSALTTINPDKAREMILKLADFLRYTLANNERQQNQLREELKNIKLYLDIEKIRFEDKFDFIEDIKEPCLNTPVPNMILQPLFENAIKHAVYETLDKVVIKLCCSPDEGFMRITLENNFEPGNSSRPGTGVGLQNIKNRLKLMYNRDNLIEIKKDDGLFKVTLFIPSAKEV
jgi:two-component system, LytTR family, sensor kinase